MERRLAAIMLTDIVGYSRLVGLDEEGTIARQRAHQEEIISPKISAHGGRIVKTTGDGLLVEFPSVVDAVNCAVEVQSELAGRDTDVPEGSRLRYRIGINLGDVVVDGDDILGDGVNVAARLEAIALNGGVCLSDIAHDQIEYRVAVTFIDGGHRQLKNIGRPIRVWHWSPHGGQCHGAPSNDLQQPTIPSLAVMPFRNLSPDADPGFLASGMTEDIISALSRNRWLFVIASNSSYAFRGRRVDARSMANELGVRYVLEGSVRRAGERVRVAARLSEPETSKQLWADHYDGVIGEIFDFQDRVTHEIASTLQPSLLDAEAERAQRRRPENLNCWDCVVRARPHVWTWEERDCELGRELLEQALALDPKYSPAHSMLALAHVISVWMGWLDDIEEGIVAAIAESEIAIQLDPTDAWAHIALGLSYGLRRENEDAISELNRAIEIDPNSALARAMLGIVKVWGGDGDGGIAELDQAVRSNPRDPFNRIVGGMYSAAHFVAGRYEEAIASARETVRKMPKAAGPVRILTAAYAMNGQDAEAASAFSTLRQLQSNISSAWVRDHFPWTDGDHMDRLVQALQLAGME